MPKVQVVCPTCQTSYQIDASFLGKRGRCKKCNHVFVVAAFVPAGPQVTQATASSHSADGATRSAPVVTKREAQKFTSEERVPAVWQEGDEILDHYAVKGILGEGGMGRVYRVFHKGWNKELAVKSVLPELVGSKNDLENLEREAETWVNLNLHPHTVYCYYVRRLGGTPWIFAELVEGGTLRDWIYAPDSQPGRLYAGGSEPALERLLDLAIQFAWGLDAAHEQGLIHQDVKPGNVMMTPDGIVKVTDFGLSKARGLIGPKAAGARAGLSILVSSGGMTPAYCSPEQATRANLSRKTDLWSWAVSVLEMFVGDVTWSSGTAAPEALEGYLDMGGDPQLPSMPVGVAELLRRCFQTDPQARPANMREVVKSLQAVYRQVVGRVYGREQPILAEALAETFNNRAVSLFDLGKKAEAEQRWQEALRLDPHHPEATYNWSLIQWRTGRLSDVKVLERLREVQASSTDPAHVNYLMGLVHLERADAPAAVQALGKATETDANQAAAATALATAQTLNGQVRYAHLGEGHTSYIFALAWSPDSHFLLSGSGDKTVRLWDRSSGQCLRTFEGHTKEVMAVDWSPDGRFVVSGSNDTTVRVWDATTGQCLQTFTRHSANVNLVAWSPDSRHVLSGSTDKTIRVWEVASGQVVGLCEDHAKWPVAVWWTDGGRKVRTFAEDGTVRILEMPGGKCGHSLDVVVNSTPDIGMWMRITQKTTVRNEKGHVCNANEVAWSMDGRQLVSASEDHTLRLWDVASGKCLRLLEGHTGVVNSVAWGPDGRSLAISASRDGTLRLWDVTSGQCLRTFEGHSNSVFKILRSADGSRILTGGQDHTVRLWDVASGRCLRTLDGIYGFSSVLSWSPDGRSAAATTSDKAVCILDVPKDFTLAPLLTSRAQSTDAGSYRRLLHEAQATLASDPAAATGLLEQARRLPGCSRREEALELARRLTRRLSHRAFAGGWEKGVFEGHTDSVNSIAWSPDGRYVCSGGMDQSVRIWDVAGGLCRHVLKGHTKGVWSVAWSPDGRFILSGSADARVWDAAGGDCLRILKAEHMMDVTAVAWSPDSRFAVGGSTITAVWMWDADRGNLMHTFYPGLEINAVAMSPDGRFVLASGLGEVKMMAVAPGTIKNAVHTLSPRSRTPVAFSPDGRFILTANGRDSAGVNHLVQMWETAIGKCLRSFAGHTDIVRSVSFSPDGRFALSASVDRTLRLWDAASGTCLRVFEGHSDCVTSAEFSPDGRFVCSAGADKTARLWELDWEFALNQPADWDDGARPFLEVFLTLHAPYVNALVRLGKPTWTDADFRQLLDKLGCAGYGWLRPEGVRREMDRMAAEWKGPPPLA